MDGDILAAVDLSDTELSNKVIDAAERVASESSITIHVTTVVPTFSMPIVGSYFDDEFEKNTLEQVQAGLKDFLTNRDDKGFKVQGHVMHGVIYDEIMKAADKLNCGIIVIAAHRPELKDYLLGPNAARVVRHAKQSVVVVRS